MKMPIHLVTEDSEFASYQRQMRKERANADIRSTKRSKPRRRKAKGKRK
jgi:hypothetical protein